MMIKNADLPDDGFLSVVRTLYQDIFPEQCIKTDHSPKTAACSPLDGCRTAVINEWLLPYGVTRQETLPYDVSKVRRDFPILSERVNGKPLVWFDNAATTQKPKCVIERIKYFYEHENSNVHRGAHTLAAKTTEVYESARNTVARFLNAASRDEIIFVRGATEGINLVACSYGMSHLGKEDIILVSNLEHHSNIVPWQMVCEKTGAKIKTVPVDENGRVIISEYESLLQAGAKMLALTHVSNALGVLNPVRELVSLAHRFGAKVLIDGAQAVAHTRVDLQAIDCDFYVFSGHKVYGPTGIGALYAKSALMLEMEPYQGGGNMIEDVTFERSRYKQPPHCFEAGTGSIADAIALGSALEYVMELGIVNIEKYETALSEYAFNSLMNIPGVKILGSRDCRTGILSFVIEGYDPEKISKLLDQNGIAVRSGHHCAQPALRRFGIENSVRVSLALYNSKEEIDFLLTVLQNLVNSDSSF